MASEVRFSLCMICKNSAHEIGRVLDNAQKVWDEVVVLDTGSTDGTQKLIKDKYPFVKLHEARFDPFDFSKARQHALSFVTGDVWMWLDSDDTFDKEVGKQWRAFAQSLHDRDADDPINYIILPYIYQVDERDVPLVIQFRERILRGVDCWEWREPLHEVCHYVGGGSSNHLAYAEYPVVHRPSRRPDEAAERNRRVLYRHYHSGDRSDRTLYYLLKTANGSGEPELALMYGLPLVERKPGGYYEYEALKGVGEAYAALYGRTTDEVYADAAIDHLTRAIRYEPQRNEARATLIDLLLQLGRPVEALQNAESLNVGLPKMVATLATEQYGTYKHAIKAMILFSYLNDPYTALGEHIKAMKTSRPHVSSFQLEKSLRVFLEDSDIGVFYCDTALSGAALYARDFFRTTGVFKEVYVYDDPEAVAYARKYYLHFTESLDTLYTNDGGIRLRKFMFDPHNTEQTQHVGFEKSFPLGGMKHTLQPYLEEIVSDCTRGVFSSLEDLLVQAKRARTPKVHFTCTGLSEWSNDDRYTPLETPRGVLATRVMGDSNLVTVSGWTDDLVACYVDTRGILRIPKANAVKTEVIPNDDTVEPAFKGVRMRVEEFKSKGEIVFVAPGIEEWDGTTPYRWGIGASESSLVYLADGFRANGYNVRVFTTVNSTRTVNGVVYVPHGLFKPDQKPWDLLVASRTPKALSGARKARKQVLWMHDVPDAYIGSIDDNMVIDHYACVSSWQAERAKLLNYKHAKLIVMPNGIRKDAVPVGKLKKAVAGRTTWISQPERGLENIHRMWEAKPELFADVWVAYGFYNILHYNADANEKTFLNVAYWKHLLRTMKAKIVGRITSGDLTALLSSTDRFVYPSSFPETFCVSVAEALQAGLRCYIAANGATTETALNVSKGPLSGMGFDELSVPTPVVKASMQDYKPADQDDWLKLIEGDAPNTTLRVYPTVNPQYYWDAITAKWEGLIQ